MDLHGSLAKEESSLAVQIRTEKLGFAQFLHRQTRSSRQLSGLRVRMALSDGETYHNMVLQLTAQRQRMLEEAGTTDYIRKAVFTPQGSESSHTLGS